jgi:hypothetical protein
MPKDKGPLRATQIARSGPLGRTTIKTPEGLEVSRSLRLNPTLATEVVAAAETAKRIDSNGGIDAAVEATAAEYTDEELNDMITLINEIEETDVSSLETPPTAGKRKKMRGGAKKEEVVAKLKDYAKAALEYAKKETGPIGSSGVTLTVSAAKLAQEGLVRVPVSVAVLTLSGTTFAANFFTSLFAKFNSWARTSGANLENMDTAEAAATAATQDLPSIAKTTAVGVVVFNQLGLLPLSAVIAAILYSFQLNVGTGPGRSLMIAQFYAYYVSRSPDQQKKVLELARSYTLAVGKAAKEAGQNTAAIAASSDVKNAASALASTLAGFIPRAPAAAASSSSSSPAAAAAMAVEAPAASGETKSIAAVLNEGVPAVAVIAEPIVAKGGDALTEEPIDTLAKRKRTPQNDPVATVVKAAEDANIRYPLRRRPLGPGSASSPGSSTASSPSSSSTVSPNTARKIATKARGKIEGGKRKTVRKIKRRVTRRKPKMPTFVY